MVKQTLPPHAAEYDDDDDATKKADLLTEMCCSHSNRSHHNVVMGSHDALFRHYHHPGCIFMAFYTCLCSCSVENCILAPIPNEATEHLCTVCRKLAVIGKLERI